ncbi:SipW-dependent-type signal peptide-containing protein [uncultured Oscillibacter sp.]|uniref:SipW-dependent-type signal peptide-containing protein n=1 Tax=uncultured Oscillibacter sp. TaxID=876091 RepID=UPI0025F69E2C|nr:SipW-dependent-type signal peptide-containing protein [uncultured Oscillibacter sp.]
MSLRKKLVLAAAAVLIVTVGAYGTLAYLTADVTTHNVITSGSVAIELLDKTAQEGQAADNFTAVYELEDFNEVYPSEEGGMPVMPGSKASKIVAVRKTEESAPCWVRVKLTENRPDVYEDGDVTLVLDEEHWTYQDGWYYYNTILTNDNYQTLPLLTQVNFSGPQIDNSWLGKSYSIDVNAQAVQSDNNSEGGVLAARGWPDESAN